MSYPEPRYFGDSGEVSARVRRADQPAELTTKTGFCSYLATGAGTHGQFGLYRWDMRPQPSGPGPHFHRTMSESFFVLSGTVRIYDGADWVEAHPGDFVFVPEGGIHRFRNESGADASMLTDVRVTPRRGVVPSRRGRRRGEPPGPGRTG